MTTQATPGNAVPDTRADGATSPRVHQAGIQGRESELRLIGDRLDEVASGSGGVIVVEGVSGIGKSRLLLEGVRDAKWRGGRFGGFLAGPAGGAVRASALGCGLFGGPARGLDRGGAPAIHA